MTPNEAEAVITIATLAALSDGEHDAAEQKATSTMFRASRLLFASACPPKAVPAALHFSARSA